MDNFILRTDVFPIQCKNPHCNHQYNPEEFAIIVGSTGLAYTDCGEFILQGFTCPNCFQTISFSFPSKQPLVDLRNFIVVPNFDDPFTNGYEQVRKTQFEKDESRYLKYKTIPAWDSDKVNIDDVFKYFTHRDYFSQFEWCPIYQSGNDEIVSRISNEIESGEFHFRRLFPDTPLFRNLLICLAPNRLTEFEYFDDDYPSGAWAEGNTASEIQERKNAWVWLIENAIGNSIEKSLKHMGISTIDEEALDSSLKFNLVANTQYKHQLRLLARKVGFTNGIDSFFNDVFNDISIHLHSDLSLAEKRIDLSGWIDRVGKGKAVFVDAPMGLGKSYSIRETLIKNKGLSAVIFMPTNRLCQDMLRNLKLGLFYSDKDYNKDEIGRSIQYHSVNGQFIPWVASQFLSNEVYYADGINKEECSYFNEITERYRLNWIGKRDICSTCANVKACRFIRHDEIAPHSRIIITTHRQYDHYFNNKNLHNWIIDGEAKPRDLFLVDEDLVFSQLYQPITLKHDQIKKFVSTITSFLEQYENTDDLRLKIKSFLGSVSKPKMTILIKGIDKDFTIPSRIIDDWNKSLPRQPNIIPEYIQPTEIIGNHLEIVQHAIRYGVVIESWENRCQIHFNNPRSYDISEAPPHAFFDGTMLDDKFLSNKFNNVEFERFPIVFTVPWKLKVYQNTNSDLPKKRIEENKNNVARFVGDILTTFGPDKKYFICPTKTIRTNYLEFWIRQYFPGWFIVIEHFGNTRGINEAKDCDVCIMLGSFMPSDSVEIAMALEFIDQSILNKDITVTKNNIWKGLKTNWVRTYNDKFAIIGEMAKAYRHSEHRQALARTRYLFHDVAFYIISKDLVSDYDPFLPEPIDKQYRADLFPHRSPRPEKQLKYDEIVEKVLEWLQTNPTVRAVDIHKAYNKRGGTVGNKLKEMLERDLLELMPDTKKTYRLADQNKNEQDIL